LKLIIGPVWGHMSHKSHHILYWDIWISKSTQSNHIHRLLFLLFHFFFENFMISLKFSNKSTIWDYNIMNKMNKSMIFFHPYLFRWFLESRLHRSLPNFAACNAAKSLATIGSIMYGVGTVSGMVTCRLVIRSWVLIYYLNPAKRTNNSSGVPTTPTPMPKSV
jgi:hypothetical protein